MTIGLNSGRACFVAFLLAMLLPLSAQILAKDIARSESVVKRLMTQTQMPGLSITVMVEGEKYWSQGFGYADLENKIEVTPNTVMRVGSISKSMTAVAIAKAVEQRQVNIDAKVSDYLPCFPRKNSTMTLRQLGGHLGGIRNYKTSSEKWIFKHYESVTESLELFQNDPLVANPGDEFHYTSYGYSLLSAATEAATEMEFLDFMEGYLWSPLGMKNSGQDDLKRIIAGRARHYMKDEDGTIANAAYVDDSYKVAGSGMLSSSSDLAQMGNALMNDSFLNDVSKKLLFDSQKTNDGKPTGYGYGWFVDMHKFLDDRKDKIPASMYKHLSELFGQRKLIWHSGTSSGAVAMLLLVPETEVVIALTTNLDGVEPQVIAAAMEIEAILSATKS